jgi:hypothetical protein
MRKGGIEVQLGPGDPRTAGSRDRIGEQPAEAYMTGADCAADRRWGRDDGNPAPDRQGVSRRSGLAGALYGRGGRWAAARRDATRRQEAADGGDDRARGRDDVGRAAGRSDALDRQGDGRTA